jgi:hypothetical protein
MVTPRLGKLKLWICPICSARHHGFTNDRCLRCVHFAGEEIDEHNAHFEDQHNDFGGDDKPLTGVETTTQRELF